MRILHIDTGRELRGGQRQVLLLLESLRDLKQQSELLARPGSPLWCAAESSGFPLQPATLRYLWQRSHAVDLVHAHDARSHTLAATVSRKPFVVSRRVAFPVKRGPLSRWKYRHAERFLAVSTFVAGQLEHSGIPSAKIDVVYDGVELAPAVLPRAHQDFAVVALSTSDPHKGRDLIEHAARLGGWPVLFSSDLSRDLARADIFLYITRSEGLGSAALLAMSCGIPVIASRVGGLPEVVVDDRTGIVIDNEPHAITAAVQRLAHDPAMRHAMGRNGRNRVAEFFTAKHLAERTLESYHRALSF